MATSLAGAKDLADMVKLQAAFWRKQFDVLTAQAEEVRTMSIKVTAAAAEPIESQMKRAVVGRGRAGALRSSHAGSQALAGLEIPGWRKRDERRHRSEAQG